MSARAIPLADDSPKEKKPSLGNARPINLNGNDINRFRSIINARYKGLAKGGIDMAKMLPTLLKSGGIVPHLLFGKSEKLQSLEEPYQRGLGKAEEKVEEFLPTRPEFLESAVERYGKLEGPALLTALTGGGAALPSTLALTGVGALAGQGVEELGGGPLLQAAAEIGPQILPSLAKKIIPSNTEQKAILALGRKYGLSEEQLAPLMPETSKKRFFGKFAQTGERTKDVAKSTKQGVQEIYNKLESSSEAKQFLSPQDRQKFAVEMSAIGKKMPHAVRAQITNDAADLVKSAAAKGGITGEELMNFYHDISSRYNVGRAELELFKGPIKNALRAINPKLATEFETVNRMYQKSLQIGRLLKPGEFEQLISLGEAYELGASVANLDPNRLSRILGLLGFRKFSQEMLTNPRLQNLIHKAQTSISTRKIPILKQVGEQIIREYQEKESE